MRIFFRVAFLLMMGSGAINAHAGSIIFSEKDATVWLPKQSIAGCISGDTPVNLIVYCNNVAYKVNINTDKTFKCMIKLKDGENEIWATCQQGNSAITSAPLMFTLGYHPLPDVKPFAIVTKNGLTLNVSLINNPTGEPLTYNWTAAKNNPAKCKIEEKTNHADVIIPAKKGVYYFNLSVKSAAGSSNFKTYVIRNNTGLHAYNMTTDHAAWIDSAVVYEINPSVFVKHGTYDAITAKLAEIQSLGINTIWLQPVYETNDSGQGYSVTDYFKLRDDYGTEQQLANLITVAKKMHLRVMFDFVPNHTSITHPYAQDCIKYGDSSHYYHFYQRNNDGKAYSSFYHKDANGFYFYFWDGLVNLDYNNPEVQQWMLEATTYWLEKYDIDGYRFDAMWGLNARSPKFIKMLSTRLKSIKPSLLLLAEDKTSDNIVYNNGFDAAYDWTADSSWVSKWTWQTHHNTRKSLTIFNAPDSGKRSALLTKAIFENSSIDHTSLRFLENNDIPRFIENHTLAQTKMAAALLFAVPGIPMLYNGQEIGCAWFPYATKTIFTTDKTIAQSDSLGLIPYYKKLIQLHSQYPALYSKQISKIQLSGNPYMFAFQRWKGNQHFIVVMNLVSKPGNAHINFNSGSNPDLHIAGKIHFTDVLTDNDFLTDHNKTMVVPMAGYSTRWLLLKKQTNQITN